MNDLSDRTGGVVRVPEKDGASDHRVEDHVHRLAPEGTVRVAVTADAGPLVKALTDIAEGVRSDVVERVLTDPIPIEDVPFVLGYLRARLLDCRTAADLGGLPYLSLHVQEAIIQLDYALLAGKDGR